MASMFDPIAFMNAQTDQAGSTEFQPVPVGEYLAICEKVEVKSWQSRDGSSSGLKTELTWDIQDDAVKAKLERPKVTVRQQQMLDLTEDGKGLDFGKGRNVGLNRIRAATDLNEAGKPFALTMFQGRMAKVKIKHRPDDNNSERIYAEVEAVAHA